MISNFSAVLFSAVLLVIAVFIGWSFRTHQKMILIRRLYLNVAILYAIWIGCGILTFAIGKPGWHVGASGIIYGLAFFLFFSGLLRKHVPLVAISLLITFLYGGLVWNMFPQFAKPTTSWEGHLSGAIAGTLCAFAFKGQGPQRRDPFEEEEPTEEGEEDEAEEAQQEAGTADGTGNDAGENPPPATQRSDAGQTAK